MKLINDFCWWLSRCSNALRRRDGKYMLVQEKRLQRLLMPIFNKQLQFVLQIMRDVPSLRENAIRTNSQADLNYLDDQLKRLPGTTKLAETIIASAKMTLNKGGKRTVDELKLGKFGIAFDLKHPDAVKYINDKKTLQLSDYKGSINHTTKERIKTIISDGIAEGKSYSELATSIKSQGEAGVFSRARAELIASHELGEAYNTGQMIPVDELTARYPDVKVQKIWLTVGDDAVTEECEANGDEGWIDYNEDFASGDFAPPRSLNPRCRCSWSQRIE